MDRDIPPKPKIVKPHHKTTHQEIIHQILKRLDNIEKRLNYATNDETTEAPNNVTSGSLNTVPEIPPQRTTFAALKCSWIPQIFTKLNAMHADIQSISTSHTNE